MLRRVPEPAPAAPIDADTVIALRAGHLDPGAARVARAGLARDGDARHFFASLEAEPDERQMRRAISAALDGPATLPRPSRWPWALGGAALAVAIVVWLTMAPPPDALPTFVLETDPPRSDGLISISSGRLAVHARSSFPPEVAMQGLLFIERHDGLHLSPLPLASQPDGSFVADAPVHRWFPAYGRYTIHVAVVPPGQRLAIRGDRLIDQQVGQAGVRWLSQPVLYQATLPR